MHRIIALDLSLTATGWAAHNGSPTPVHGLIKPRGRGIPRLQDALDQVVEVAAGAELAVIEGYAFSSRASHAHGLGELGGVIRLGLTQKGVTIVEVPPASMKKVATGRGNASKELVLVEAVKRLGYRGADNNISDALWLLQTAQQHYDLPGKVDLPKTHLSGLTKIEWPEVA